MPDADAANDTLGWDAINEVLRRLEFDSLAAMLDEIRENGIRTRGLRPKEQGDLK